MRYKIFVSNGHDCYSFYEVVQSTAELLYRMAVESKLFEYVSLSKCIDEDFLEKDWEAFNNDFDEVEEAVANACVNAKRIWEEVREDDDREKGAFFKGRWSAFKDVLEIMSYKGA